MDNNIKYETHLIQGSAADRTEFLNCMAATGWRLIAVDSGLAYFEKPIAPPPTKITKTTR